ncbi:non-ribosomal peptide synthetase [Brucella gallinifaecis]|uniref:non-ribosomal peptide synthetase n=1 Tax=Brucella gallinifaecis TaxID=215590 RepID=UPI00235E2C8F|nr:non-ribosomal peptide synthetase [Brucella gallinifaecis]
MSEELSKAVLAASILTVSQGCENNGLWCFDYASGRFSRIDPGNGQETIGEALRRIGREWKQSATVPELNERAAFADLPLLVIAPDEVAQTALVEQLRSRAGFVPSLYLRADMKSCCISICHEGTAEQKIMAGTFSRMAGQLSRQLSDTGKPLSTISVLDDTDSALLDSLNDTARPYPSKSLGKLFRKAVKNSGDRIAVNFGTRKISYRSLLDDAERVAAFLVTNGAQSGDAVGIYGERSPGALQAILGCVLAGCIYVPLSPAWPEVRSQRILDAAGILTIIDCTGDKPSFEGRNIIALEHMTDNESRFTGDDGRSADDCAYILFTSGSSGQPKGVMIPHRGIVRLVFDGSLHPIEPGMAVMHAAPLSFDASTKEIWLPLLHGGTISGFAKEEMLTAASFMEARKTRSIDFAFFTYALFDALLAQAPQALAGIKRLHVGGEAVQPAAVRAALGMPGSGAIINSYGPTEATVYAVTHEIDMEDVRNGIIPIGRPIANTTAYILDAHGRQVPCGSEGELYLGGDGLALGYLGDEKLTSERFVRNPFSGIGTLYRTGDKVKLRHDGVIEYLGRIDDQIKLRGHRIEPGEIEFVLGAVTGVDRAVVRVHEPEKGDRRLAAWIKPEQPENPMLLRNVEEHARRILPDYMVPSWFILVNSFPRTAHGKLDIRALPVPGVPTAENIEIDPADPLGSVLAIIRQVLVNRDFAADDSFLGSGGDSLLAVKCAQRITKACGITPPISILFETATAKRLADYIRLASWAREAAQPAPGEQPPAIMMRF